ncbi:hypothetical protein [Streptomyces sp. NRRL S-495]|uniref:hypothetical protein n=1 Tax=Streptomyces sp. NRRL S-495 TaxID=1609133 RepID=UPI0005F97BB0|nr:hypothetical protein [Streptomyces sp. NRRL S-495]KJY38807.1 hypothetical protein VR45_04635 [Streptomyces sp. NRRL S-495]
MAVRSVLSIRSSCALAISALLASGCSAGGPSFEASQNDIVGTWSNPKGARLVIEPGDTFRAEKLPEVVAVQDGCDQALSGGKWLLLGDHTSVARTSDPQGSAIDLRPSSRAEALACSVLAKIAKDTAGINLCLVEDEDQSCAGGDLLRKVPPARG